MRHEDDACLAAAGVARAANVSVDDNDVADGVDMAATKGDVRMVRFLAVCRTRYFAAGPEVVLRSADSILV